MLIMFLLECFDFGFEVLMFYLCSVMVLMGVCQGGWDERVGCVYGFVDLVGK